MSSTPDWLWWPGENPMKKSEVPSIPHTSQVSETVPTTQEEIEAVTEAEKAKITGTTKKKRSTILTGMQGILTPSNLGLKTLLGE